MIVNIRKVTDELSVSPQVSPDNLAELATLGFKSVICNRPDGEEHGQPSFSDIEQAATAAGLEIRYLPIYHTGMGADDLDASATAFTQMAKPILAYCRSGARSAAVWNACR